MPCVLLAKVSGEAVVAESVGRVGVVEACGGGGEEDRLGRLWWARFGGSQA